jgi:hypothetical protein
MQNSMRAYAGQAGQLVSFTRGKLSGLAQANEQVESITTQLDAAAAELEQMIGTRDSLANELTTERSRSAELESRLTALEKEAADAREAAAEASRQAIEAYRREADAAQQHAMQIQLLSSEHGKAQEELRGELARAIDELREKLRESEASGSAAKIELARMEERTANLAHERATLREALAALARADALIRAAREEQFGRWRLIGQALGLSRGPQSWRALLSWKVPAVSAPAASPQDSTLINGKEQSMSNSGSSGSRNPYLRANSLPQLLAWDDIDFVRCAYVTILGRQPDAEGEAYYLNRIRRGRSKMEVLWQLRSSSEGRCHDPGIVGLDRALKRAKRERIPIVGTLMRAANRNSFELSDREMLRAILNGNARLNSSIEYLGVRLEALELGMGPRAQHLPREVESRCGYRPLQGNSPTQVRVPPIIKLSKRIRAEWLAAT